MTNTITVSFMSANYVAREVGYAMHGWGHGDRMTNEAFAPIGTFFERFESLLGHIQGLGFDAIDLWGAHLSPAWATDEHVEVARAALARRRMHMTTYAPWVDAANVHRACELAVALGAPLIGAGFAGDAEPIASAFREHGIRMAVENHPERTPAELLDKLARGEGAFGATVDTGWWATQRYDAARAIQELGTHVLHVHLKDVVAEGEPHETCRFGDGIVDVRECVRALERIGYEGAISIEHEPETYEPSEGLGAMRAELEEWLA
jgi:sugar phosphate isomerase/epimerase